MLKLLCGLAFIIALIITGTFGSPVVQLATSTPRPLVFWHGLGDSHSSSAMLEFFDLVKEMHPDIFIHSIFLHEDLTEDRRAGFFGNVNEQVANVSLQLSSIPELKAGFDAVGFSQGGQFLRAYVEKYNDPPVNNLITFGSQHMGVSDLPLCSPWDVFCLLARRAARGGVYTEWAQQNLVQAQYYRDPDQLSKYFSMNHFMADINNEVGDNMNTTYTTNLLSLNKLVLVLFTEDKTVVPKESSWFGSFAPSTEPEQTNWPGTEKTIVPMRMQPIYVEDRIGLRTLDERGDVVLETCDGEHMQLSSGCWRPILKKFAGELVGGDVMLTSHTEAVLRVQY